MDQPTIVERAFALARSGECDGVSDVRRRLKDEQLSSIDAHLAGPSIKRQLSQLCSQAIEAKGEDTPVAPKRLSASRRAAEPVHLRQPTV